MGFTETERGWADRYCAVTWVHPYRDIRQILPIDELAGLGAAACLFNPIRRAATGEIAAWAEAAPARTREDLVDHVQRAANVVADVWDKRFTCPILGVPDPAWWQVLDSVLPHHPVKATRFPIASPRDVEVTWAELTQLLATNNEAAPVIWWDVEQTYIVATPYDSTLTYVCAPAATIDDLINAATHLEVEPLS